jgi:glyoxylase-like metal-dependent hydrolase (beta-lactamase superfamily II)
MPIGLVSGRLPIFTRSHNMVLHCLNWTELGNQNMTDNDNFSVTQYPGGVTAIDSGYHRENLAACYMLEAASEVAFIEVGTNSSTPRLMQTLRQRGWAPEDVRYVIVTHVHLDHAGGAGGLMQQLPNATLLVHPYGARHMIDPSKLEAGARVVYGDSRFDRIFGSLIPIDEARTQIMNDGDRVNLGERQLRFMDTPGHARHHFCVHDDHTNGWFTGDTFGLSYREFDTQNGAFILPTTTPVQFDPSALKASVRRLADSQPDCMYLTHYGRVGEVQKLAAKMLEGVSMFAEFGETYKGDDSRNQKIKQSMSEWLLADLCQHGVKLSEQQPLQLLQDDINLNTQGIECWLDYRERL